MPPSKGDGPADSSREAVSNATTCTQTVATTRPPRHVLRDAQPKPNNSRRLSDFGRQLDRLMRDPRFGSLRFTAQSIVIRGFHLFGHGPRNGGCDGYAWFSWKTLGDELNVHPHTVRRAFRDAQSVGLLSITEQEWDGSRSQANNKFQLAPEFCNPVAPLQPSPVQGCYGVKAGEQQRQVDKPNIPNRDSGSESSHTLTSEPNVLQASAQRSVQVDNDPVAALLPPLPGSPEEWLAGLSHEAREAFERKRALNLERDAEVTRLLERQRYEQDDEEASDWL